MRHGYDIANGMDVSPDEEGECGCEQTDCPQCDGPCRDCAGDGWVLVGCDVDVDFERGWHVGDGVQCPNCRGSGRASDMWFW